MSPSSHTRLSLSVTVPAIEGHARLGGLAKRRKIAPRKREQLC